MNKTNQHQDNEQSMGVDTNTHDDVVCIPSYYVDVKNVTVIPITRTTKNEHGYMHVLFRNGYSIQTKGEYVYATEYAAWAALLYRVNDIRKAHMREVYACNAHLNRIIERMGQVKVDIEKNSSCQGTTQIKK